MTNYTKTSNVKLNLSQIEYLRGVIYEYYSKNEYMSDDEAELHYQLEQILAQHSNKIFG